MGDSAPKIKLYELLDYKFTSKESWIESTYHKLGATDLEYFSENVL